MKFLKNKAFMFLQVLIGFYPCLRVYVSGVFQVFCDSCTCRRFSNLRRFSFSVHAISTRIFFCKTDDSPFYPSALVFRFRCMGVPNYTRMFSTIGNKQPVKKYNLNNDLFRTNYVITTVLLRRIHTHSIPIHITYIRYVAFQLFKQLVVRT